MSMRVDSAYVDAQLLIQAQEQGITLVGPTRPDVSWQARADGAFDLTQFEVDWQQHKVRCPQGQESVSWVEYMDHAGNPYFQVRFAARDCLACPVRSRCTRAQPHKGRVLKLMRQVEYEAIKAARLAHASPEGQQRYKRRAGVEGTISQGVRAFGLRRSRYRGLSKTHLHSHRDRCGTQH